jgi:hypothetical protein
MRSLRSSSERVAITVINIDFDAGIETSIKNPMLLSKSRVLPAPLSEVQGEREHFQGEY